MLYEQYKASVAPVSPEYNGAKRFLDKPRKETAKSFIRDSFVARAKERLFLPSFAGDNDYFSKATHTASAFLLGMSLSEIVESRVKRLIERNAPLHINNFNYPWLLCCMYHDAFSEYESNHTDAGYPSLEEFIKKSEIEHTIYNHNYPEGITDNRFRQTYKEDTIRRYFDKRECDHLHDHGIIAGYLGYDRLVKNFIDYWKAQNCPEGVFKLPKDPQRKVQLIGEMSQLWVFAMVADAIIAHNIWHTSDSRMAELKDGGPGEKKLSAMKTPLAYFLGVIDTIEPVKYFYNEKPKEIFDNISITLNGGELLIEQSEACIFDFKMWFDAKMAEMPKWLKDTEAKFENDRMIRIKIDRG